MPTLHLLVEGEGDIQAAPILLRRLLHEEYGRYEWQVEPKHTMKVWGLAKLRSRLADFIEHLRGKRCDGALILLDLEDQLPCEEAPALAEEIAALRPLPFPVVIVFAYREYEAWLLASLASIAAQSAHFPDGLSYEENPEGKRNAKKELEVRMPALVKYKEVLHQAEFTKYLDFEQARRAPSFQRLERAMQELLTAVDNGAGAGMVSPRRK
ncbi:DUF4276 family protein [Hymenobacter sp. ASUV-10]|uniref:DUF4276 family protein n=1 Tax=Hymenobacter aranciens TaxID=3063996 RepID=A0ABT9BG96_9BACT|nr:DUF4276 family protein [Hymenobacter sp. ASUV-10]MDO7877296.1 DUF4276 family protein [Hymenobacter sp. ASUV-10]